MNTLKIGNYGAWTATSAVAVILAVITAAATVFVGFWVIKSSPFVPYRLGGWGSHP